MRSIDSSSNANDFKRITYIDKKIYKKIRQS